VVENRRKTFLRYAAPAVLTSLLMILLACRFISYSRIESVIDRIRSKGGAVQARSALPSWVQSFSPDWLLKKYQRPYAVWLPQEFGDEEVLQVLEVKGLTSLTATGTKITEKSLARLVNYKGLKLLYLSRKMFSQDQLKWLEKNMPGTTVIY